jgi:hypothetical protein
MTRGVNQIENIVDAGVRAVVKPYGLSLDGNAPLTFQIHFVKELVLLVPVGNRSGILKKAVSQGRFAVIDVSDNGEVADSADFHEFLRTLKIRTVKNK